MAPQTTMTIRVPPDVKDKLDRIAADTRRSPSLLAGEAVAAYVDRELAVIEGIKRGLSDADDGNVVSHDDAMAEIEAVIAAAESKRAREA
ncbi:CopG family ribbon-helix-helix protein [Segnochrobactrum spirostomi]|uniref:Ribbon-helix-helix protein, CopG family n=1 Tax=Segnochrobactrum spirostomi TaxID=2608987 RepID=A0A6A7Y2D2_9HYPH|nr:CopG family ribbon-helix-helix protein [Segnochrobactrum spirostomi]MQT13210.1 ribbon-helix-helix protein, CopG family [Segnochrobactrum spirostomi]